MHLVTLLCKLSGHQADVKCALFLHGDTHMVTGGADNILCVWDVQERQRTQVLEGHTNWIYGLCQHMVDDVLASGSDDCTIRLWDTKTNEKMDKDRFRRDLGKVEEAYQEVAKRLGILPEAGIRDLKGPEAMQ